MKQPITKQQIELLEKENKDLQLIDIRSKEEYAKQHIPGAINIPSELLQEYLSTYSKEIILVCVCNHGHGRSQGASELIANAGYNNSYYLLGGTAGWYSVNP